MEENNKQKERSMVAQVNDDIPVKKVALMAGAKAVEKVAQQVAQSVVLTAGTMGVMMAVQLAVK